MKKLLLILLAIILFGSNAFAFNAKINSFDQIKEPTNRYSMPNIYLQFDNDGEGDYVEISFRMHCEIKLLENVTLNKEFYDWDETIFIKKNKEIQIINFNIDTHGQKVNNIEIIKCEVKNFRNG